MSETPASGHGSGTAVMDGLACPMSGCDWRSASWFIDAMPVAPRDTAALRLLDAEALVEHLREDHDAYDPREPA